MVLRILFPILSLCCALGCSLLLSPLEPSGDADAIDSNDSDQLTDSGKDTSPGDADEDDQTLPDAETVDADLNDCPMNSGAFCLCDRPWEDICDDGSFCLTVENLDPPGEFGFCAPECSCSNYNNPCPESHFGLEPRCILTNSWPITYDTMCNCVLIHCDINDQCPPGQTCQTVTGFHGEYEGIQVNICSP